VVETKSISPCDVRLNAHRETFQAKALKDEMVKGWGGAEGSTPLSEE
jgi:hypothetical protein